MNIITQIDPTKQDHGVYPLDHKYDILNIDQNIDQIRIMTFGIKKHLPLVPQKHVVVKIDRKTDGISLSAKKRLIKITSAMEQFEVKVSHMITFTLPHQRWEEIPDDQKAKVWRAIKNKLLKALGKLLSRQGKETSHLWFQEFQQKNNRGAPHLHVLIDIGQLPNNEWHKMLNKLIHIWKNSLNWNDKDGEFPSQSVDFHRMRARDFRYARKYASKAKQKDAPFVDNWGNWWGRGGVWKKIKIHDYSANLNLLSKTDQEALVKVFRNNTWLTWSLLRYRDKNLHDKLQAILLKPFDYNQPERGSVMGKNFFERFERAITSNNNKKDDMLFSKHIVSFSFPDNQIIQQSQTPCQEATNPCQRSDEKGIQTKKQLTLDITLL
jgi:hypothetical protein